MQRFNLANSTLTGTGSTANARSFALNKSNDTLSIEELPSEGWAIRCGMTFTFGGMKIEAKTAQMQHVAGRAIPGHYAAGEMVGGLWVGNYASGSGMTAGETYGRIAGTHAALAVLW